MDLNEKLIKTLTAIEVNYFFISVRIGFHPIGVECNLCNLAAVLPARLGIVASSGETDFC